MFEKPLVAKLMRGGQVFFLHNEVRSIEQAAKTLQELVPEARIGIGHGQMKKLELEQVMNDFYHRRLNVLVCTTIIETGWIYPTPTPSLLNGQTNLASRNCISYAVG